MEPSLKTPDPSNRIEVRLQELIDLILPLHALLEGSQDETTARLEQVIDALADIAHQLHKTVKAMTEERSHISPTLDQRLAAIARQQDAQMQMLADLHEWLGAPQPAKAAPGS